MIKLVAVAFELAVATSAQAMSPAPLQQPDDMVTQIREACGAGRVRIGAGRVRINGVCVARTPSAKFAGARDGMEALAFGGTEEPARPSALALFCADTEPGEGRLEASVKALVGDVGDGWKVALANTVVAKTCQNQGYGAGATRDLG
jgi:hypothetical protein